jgi:hypothetical protein
VIPVRVLFTDAHTFEEAVASWEAANRGRGAHEGYNPHRHRVVVGAGGRVLKDNTGFCRNDDGTFKAPA